MYEAVIRKAERKNKEHPAYTAMILNHAAALVCNRLEFVVIE